MSHKILLADDSVTVQKIVTLTFSDEGVDVVPVNTGDDAVKRLQSLRPALVMADVSIPGKNGYEICDFIKSHPELKNIPVILLVPAFEPFDEERAARVGADHHLTKPFQSIRTLISTVKSLIEPETRNVPTAPEIVWPSTNPEGRRNTGGILDEALAQDDDTVKSAKEPDTGDLQVEFTEKLPPLPDSMASETVLPPDTAKLPMAKAAPVPSLSHWDDDILELDDVLPPIPALGVKPVAPTVTMMNAQGGSITQSLKVTAVEAVTTIPPSVIDDIVNRVAAQVAAQVSQQLQQFATRLSQDIARDLATQFGNARSNMAIPPAPSPRRDTESLLDL